MHRECETKTETRRSPSASMPPCVDHTSLRPPSLVHQPWLPSGVPLDEPWQPAPHTVHSHTAHQGHTHCTIPTPCTSCTADIREPHAHRWPPADRDYRDFIADPPRPHKPPSYESTPPAVLRPATGTATGLPLACHCMICVHNMHRSLLYGLSGATARCWPAALHRRPPDRGARTVS